MAVQLNQNRHPGSAEIAAHGILRDPIV